MNTYQILPSDRTFQFSVKANTLVQKALDDEIISKMEASFLKKSLYIIPYFYHLPKVHKITNPPESSNSRQAHFILEALQFCLKHNYFESDGTPFFAE